MRADYGSYIVAIICFIIAALPVISQEILQLESTMRITLAVIFAALGLILIILGYSMRPRPIISVPEAPKPALPPSEPAPSMLPQEETVKPEEKKPRAKTRRKRTRRKREKT